MWTHVRICICMCVYIYIYVCIYIYREREREKETLLRMRRQGGLLACRTPNQRLESNFRCCVAWQRFMWQECFFTDTGIIVKGSAASENVDDYGLRQSSQLKSRLQQRGSVDDKVKLWLDSLRQAVSKQRARYGKQSGKTICCVYIYIYIHICVYIERECYSHIYIYIYTYIHIHVYIYIYDITIYINICRTFYEPKGLKCNRSREIPLCIYIYI